MTYRAVFATAVCLSCLCWCTVYTDLQSQGATESASHYFWNEVTGDTQYEDPGDVPLHDDQGNCFWLDESGNRLDQDPNAGKYAWVETWSEEHNRPFYYDQVNQISTWDKPADLAWRRVYIDPEAPGESASGTESKPDAQLT